MGNFRVVKFSLICGQYKSAKIKIGKIFSYFRQTSVEEFVASMIAVCDSYFPQVGIHLRQDQ